MRTNKIIEAIHEGQFDERLNEIYADPYIISYEKIAKALNVPMWQLFASPEETKGEDLIALIQYKSDYYKATSVDELKKIIFQIEEK